MSVAVVFGAGLRCQMGSAPGILVTAQTRVLCGGRPAATIMDGAPMANVLPCGMCTSPANPMVASATAAALGVLVPMPCIPATGGVWMPGSHTPMLCGKPALGDDAKLMCVYGGQISITNPGQTTVMY